MTMKTKNFMRKPEWLRKKIDFKAQKEMDQLLNESGIHTICQEARCPNISECFANKNATFLILGNICTRRCTYCNLKTGKPFEVNQKEIDQVTTSVQKLGLKYIVITSPARDDLKDGGSLQFYKVTQDILEKVPGADVELLIPDFKGKTSSLQTAVDSGASVIGHNIETVPSLYKIRKASTYTRSIDVLKQLKELGAGKIKTKSAIMVGLGETHEEMTQVFKDLREVGCDFLSIGQYLQPTGGYEEVKEYVTPETFALYKREALDMGFEFVHSTPYARSSYMAHEYKGKKTSKE